MPLMNRSSAPRLGLVLALAAAVAAPAGAAATGRFVRWNADGGRLFVAVKDSIQVFDAGGAPLKSLRADGPVAGVAVAPNGRALVLSTQDGRAWLWDVDSGVKTALFEPPAGAPQAFADPAWSADSTALVFTVVEFDPAAAPMGPAEKKISVYWARADGTGKKLLVTAAP